MSKERCWNVKREKKSTLGKGCSSAILYATYPIQTCRGMDPALRSYRPVNSRLNQGTAS
jgi:hypothetical protein